MTDSCACPVTRHGDHLEHCLYGGLRGRQPIGAAAMRDDPGAGFGLTAREVEVGRLLCRGMANKEIAAALTLQINTVKTHVEHIMTKTASNNRVRVVLLLMPYLGH